jgi:hypothetical protein
MHKIGKTFSNQISFLPTKDLLMQIIKCEGLDKYFEGKTLEQITKQELIARIMIGDHQTEPVDKVKINKNPDSHLLRSCSTNNLDPVQQEEDNLLQSLQPFNSELKELFSIYASYGDPTNTIYLKSAKLQKMIKDAGLVSDHQDKSNLNYKKVSAT